MLSKTVKQLNSFTSDKAFDLYTQSPWLTGSDMSTILARVTWLGLETFNKDGYLSSLLHLYNMLQQLGVPCFAPILDHLCELFGSAVFQDLVKRPTRDFFTKLQVCNGEFLMRNGITIFYLESEPRRTLSLVNNPDCAPKHYHSLWIKNLRKPQSQHRIPR
jgi:hypothetical protein